MEKAPKLSDSKESMNNGNFNLSSKANLAAGGDDDYDPGDYRDFVDGLGTMGALFHMIKGSLGSGILAMPMAFKNAGLWVGLIGAFLIGFLCTHCVRLLALCSQVLSKRTRQPSLGFAETTEAAFLTGPERLRKYAAPAREMVNIGLTITYYFGVTVYIVFIATNFKQVIDNHLGIDLNIRLYIAMLTVVLIPIGCIRKLKYLVPLSFLAIVFLMFGCGVVLYEVFADIPPLSSRPAFNSWKNLPLFYATMCFAIEGVGTVLPIENSMKRPSSFLGCPGVLNVAMFWLVLTYTMVGFFGYLRYGDATQGAVTLNLGFTALGQTVKILVALNVLFSCPLLLYVPCETLWKYMDPRISEANKTRSYYTMRVLMILGSVGLAIIVPNLEPIIGIVGAFCFSTLGLLFPSILELVTFWGNDVYMGRWRWRYYKNYLLMVAWLIALVAGMKASIGEVIDIYWPSS
ncbi:proton-coupled amino acid transporter-like protein pathetic [Homalodisca vitripennis]|uniref:proton-coupled amino acid transporter-like protein pathetic n=1 Tax=Homalodisca vitripennis TaxID=197043 RepID=UPI001EEBA60A|nr:proton-coupled amino acid transporter-like protein pathetic [Homalodisca vitripennis]